MRRRTAIAVVAALALLGPAVVVAAAAAENKAFVPQVECSKDRMKIVIDTAGTKFKNAYLTPLKGSDECQPKIDGNRITFDIDLSDDFRCSTMRITDTRTGQLSYANRVSLEHEDSDKIERIPVACSSGFMPNRVRRQALPNLPNIVEPDHINITEYIEARAPIPNLDLGIRQNGRMLDTTYNVQPGTPLEMVIYLDSVSKPTYGILTSFLKVSDSAGKQEEVIVMNGCSIDPYIFSNFVTPDNGDSLSAAFKAFKFPDSNYVMFSGTVSICINQCKPIPCGNGQFGYGRRRRREATPERDPNAIYSVDMTTMLRVQFDDDFFTLQKGAVSADFQNASAPAHHMNHIEGVDISAEEYSASASSHVLPSSLPLAAVGLFLITAFANRLAKTC